MNLGTYLKGISDSLSGKSGDTDYEDTIKKILEITGATQGSRLPDRPNLGDGATYERLSYDAPTDEDITRSATSALSKYLSDGLNSIEKETESKRKGYQDGISSLDRTMTEQISALDKAYADAIRSASNDALKRGLARSSIAVNAVGAIESANASARASVADDYARRVSELNDKITLLEGERTKAINDFNIGYTVKLSQEIEKAKEERDKKQAEVIKYNNSLTEKENDEKIERAKAESELYSEALDQKKAENQLYDKPSSAQKEYEYAQIYQVLREKLASMDAISASKEVNQNPLFKNYLNTEYFYKLYDEFGR